MLNSQSAIASVRRQSSPEQVLRVAPSDRRDIPAERLTPATEISKAESGLPPETRPTMALVYWFFLEGFALYGASVHGLATPELSWRKRRKSNSPASSPARAERAVLESEGAVDRRAFGSGTPSTRDVAAGEFDQYRSVHPGGLSMIWRAIASGRAKRRREREIERAVDALADYEVRLLRAMGFSYRSQIEQTVRNGRDC